MGLQSMLSSWRPMHRKAVLTTDISLDNGESRSKGDIVSVLADKGNGKFHVEDNEFSCTVDRSEIEFLQG